MLAVLTAPLAVSKYVAPGEGAASARVAKWDVKFTLNPVTGSTGYFNGTVVSANHPLTGSAYPTQTTTRTFRIKNDSEVAADVTIQLRYVTNDAAAVTDTSTLDTVNATSATAASGIASVTLTTTHSGTITGSGSTFGFSAGADGTFTITTKATNNAPQTPGTTSGAASYWQNCIRKYEVYFNAVQID